MPNLDLNNFNPDDYDSKPMPDPGFYVCVTTWMKRVREPKHQIQFHMQPIINTVTHDVVSNDVGEVFETATFTEKAIWRFANLCAAIGTGRFNANSDREVMEKVLGRPFKAKIVADTYNGKERRRMESYFKINKEEETAYSKWEEDNALGSSSSSSMGNFDSGPSSNPESSWGSSDSASTSRPSNPDADFTDDDIPF